ncbi:hypothetical protein AGLY_015158 [Aphis glycines]|uniref:HAT C-terminal dimerisation domain-containing protein n=1 Tax=Aphis glycines TaxID=307491 RepID=A0A6G0T3F6_APHGL|nr:hypothetical protein AGLY_015158 [Aphis glycines]
MNKNWRHIPCLAHTINLIAQAELEEINHVYKKVKKVVEFFKRSTQSYKKLKNTQTQMGYPELKLIQDVTTRWNSTFDMFQRCILIKEPLISTIAIIGNVDNLTNEDFEIMQHYCEIFKPFKEATVELSSEKGVSISKVLIITQMLHSHIKNNIQNIQLPHTIHLMLSRMLTKADKKFEGIENQRRTYDQIVEKIAAIIKRNKNNNEHNINTPLNNNAIENETSEIWKHFDAQVSTPTLSTPTSEAIVEIDRYISELLLDRKSDPLKWWNNRRNILSKFV